MARTRSALTNLTIVQRSLDSVIVYDTFFYMIFDSIIYTLYLIILIVYVIESLKLHKT